MDKYISYDKLSKKKKKEIDRKSRGDWMGLNPVTRVKESKKIYSRKRLKSDRYDGF